MKSFTERTIRARPTLNNTAEDVKEKAFGESDSILCFVTNTSINLNKKRHIIDPREGNYEQAPDMQDILSETNINAHDYLFSLIKNFRFT